MKRQITGVFVIVLIALFTNLQSAQANWYLDRTDGGPIGTVERMLGEDLLQTRSDDYHTGMLPKLKQHLNLPAPSRSHLQ